MLLFNIDKVNFCLLSVSYLFIYLFIFSELADFITEAVGKPVKYERISYEQFDEGMAKLGDSIFVCVSRRNARYCCSFLDCRINKMREWIL